jgi:hypothetical protein
MNRQNVGRSVDQGKIDRAKAQQAVLNELRKGNVITGAQPANPVIGGLQALFGGAGKGAIPPLGAARLKGEEVLINRGGWDPRRAGSGPINVGGQTFYPAQSGQDLVYKRAPGLVGGQYGSLFSSASGENLPPPEGGGKKDIENRDYENKKRLAAQLAAQDQLTKKYRVADLTKAYNTAKGEEKERLGLEIWATTNPQLAAKLKPGQLGYSEAVSTFQSQSPLGAFAKAAGDMQFANKLGEATFAPGASAVNAFEVTTPLTGVSFTPPSQVGISEAFNAATAFPEGIEAFTDPLKFLKPDLTQTQQALLKQAFNQALK